MSEQPLLEATTGMAIRELLLRGENTAWDFYRLFRQRKPSTTYDSVRKYFYILRQLGLIRFIREEPSREPLANRRIYGMVADRADDPAWRHPQQALYPATRWGARRYQDALERGDVETGRAE